MAPSAARAEFEHTALPELDALYGVALGLTRNRVESDDLVQDTMLRAYRFWHTFKPGTNAKAWLLAILRNTFINRYHRASQRHEVGLEHEPSSDSAIPGVLGLPPPPPDQAVARALTRERILAAMESLPTDYRLAVTLADLEGLSYKEIAEIMDCPIGTVMSRIHRGRRLLYSLLHDHARELEFFEPEGPEAEVPPPVSLAAHRSRGKS